MTTIAAKLQTVRDRIDAACAAAGRPAGSVGLLAVSKTFGPEAVQQAILAGQTAFGENYIQEAVDKIQAVREWESAQPGLSPSEWHCIGPIQSNKTRLVAENFDWVHSVDRLKVAQRLSDQRPQHLPALQVCLQVNTDGGATKSGIPPQDLEALARAVVQLPRLRLRGLMTIPDPVDGFEAQCALHALARAEFDRLKQMGLPLDTLSMGMSGDLEAAIHAGSNLVRVGTAIFGGRS